MCVRVYACGYLCPYMYADMCVYMHCLGILFLLLKCILCMQKCIEPYDRVFAFTMTVTVFFAVVTRKFPHGGKIKFFLLQCQ